MAACAIPGCAAPASASRSSTPTACGATTPGASPASAWKAASATRKARKAAGQRLRSNQLLVRAVAERLVTAVLAAAQPHLLRLADGELDRREFGALVRAVAERLAPGAAAGAPPVVSRGKLYGVRRLLRDRRVRHRVLPVTSTSRVPGNSRSECAGRGKSASRWRSGRCAACQ